MLTEKLQFLIPARCAVDTLKGELLDSFDLADDGQSVRRRHFYDTFDWRLYRHNLTLEEEHTDHCNRLVMRDLNTGAVKRWVENVEMPRFAGELGRGPFRERLLELTTMRALLPVAEIKSHAYLMRLRDKEEKTVARIEFELAALNGDAHTRRLPKRLLILPVRGHPKQAARLIDFAAGKLSLPVAETALLDDALAAIGRKPVNYTNKPRVELDPAEPAEQAIRRILLKQLQIIEINVPGTCQYIDTEYLHDLRIGVRQTRSLLGQFRSVLPTAEIEPFEHEFAWVGKITGPCRDLDVHLLGFDGYQARLKRSMQPALEPVRRYLVRQHSEEQRRLAAWLQSPRFRALLLNWRQFLITSTSGAAAEPTIKELADNQIWALYRRIIKRGRRIDDETPDRRLHRLRILAKKLRYLIEALGSLYPKSQIKAVVKSLKSLQRNLGDFHDYCVQIDVLERIATDMAQQKLAGTETLKAIEALRRKLAKQRDRSRRKFVAIFNEFDRPANRKKVRRLFNGSGK